MRENPRELLRENLHHYLQDLMMHGGKILRSHSQIMPSEPENNIEDNIHECISEIIEAHERYKFLINHVNDITFKNEIIQYRDRQILEDIMKDVVTHNTSSSLNDFTEKNKIKHRLREIFESEEKYRFLIENIGEIIFTCDSDYRFTFLNPQWENMLGFPVSVTLGSCLIDYVQGNDLPIVKEKLHRLFTKSVKIVNLEYKIRDAEGLWKNHLMTCTPIHDYQGKVVELIGVSRDITEHKTLQEKIRVYNEQLKDKVRQRTTEVNVALKEIKDVNMKLIQSDKMAAIGELSSGVAHEFNNLIGIMQAYADFVGKQPTDNNVKKLIDVVLTSSKRAKTITESLLSFARRITPLKELSDLHATIDEVLLLMENDFRKSNITVIRKYDPNIPAIVLDSGQMGQVFLNLFVNAKDALSHKRTGGQVIVSTCDCDKTVLIKISDNGIGIKKSYLDKIFDPFVSTKGSYGQSKTPGTGLGLSVSLGIIENHQGTIEVQSTEHVGTIFSIVLPKKQNTGVSKTTETMAGRTVTRASGEDGIPQRPYPQAATILLADDDEYFRNALSDILTIEGYNLVQAEDGETTINLFKNSQFDLVLLDLLMPGIDGVETIRILRNIKPDVKIIVLTGDTQSRLLEEAQAYSIQGIIRKPFDIDTLVHRINIVVEEEKVVPL
ncbi:MAG: response regulator [Candidatus Auribacterota bacterium]|nr:response regulator [Candidatus Auribacterota bacterium]